MGQNFPDNALYEMDNLDVLRGMNSETVDLIATDPPFNTKRNRSGSAGFYVDNWKYGDTGILPDQWRWNEVHPKWLEEIKDGHTALYHAIDAAKHCQGEDTAAFLCFLSVRLLEMHRVLKPTGSIYLHCDPTASHYIKTCMDAIFGKTNFLNEIIWHYDGPQRPSRKNFGRKHDVIFRFSKSSQFYANPDAIVPLRKLTEDELSSYSQTEDGRYYYDLPRGSYTNESIERLDKEGRIRWTKNGNPRVMFFLDRDDQGNHYRKKQRHDVWQDIPSLGQVNTSEKTGSPDQKPIELYKRFIEASSNEGDLVLDPFCGCATTIIAANNLNRRWVGIDRRVDARYHIITRLMGVTRKERERLEEFAIDKEWLQRQTQKYEIHYQTEPPVRTDDAADAPPELAQVYHTPPEKLHTHAEMRELLVGEFGVKCWGCNFEPPDERYLHLDHITPKSDGGTNHIDNRALLCQPCNSKKSNTMTLTALRRANKRDGHLQAGETVNLTKALYWTRERLIEKVRETPSQYS